MTYTFTLSDGITTLADVPVLDNDGLGSKSTPRQILDIGFNAGANYFVLDGDLTARLITGFSFDVIDSPYAGTYTVVAPGSSLTIDGASTIVPVAAVVPNSLTIFDVNVAGGKWTIEGVDNGPCLFYPGSSVSVSGNSLPAANISYTVLSAISSQPHTIIGVVTGLNGTVTVVGDQTGSFIVGKIFRISANFGNGNGNYTIQSAVFGAGNTVITVTGTIPAGTTISGLATPTPAITHITVSTPIPVGAGTSGDLTPPASISYPLVAPSVIVTPISPGQFTIMWRIAGNHATKFTPGCHVAVRNNSFFEYQQFGVVSATYSAPNTEITVSFSSQTTPTPDTSGALVHPIPSTPYGYIQYDTPVSSSLKLIGKGSPYYNDTTTWGQALQDNQVHMLENFANDLPPVAPITGQQWYDPTLPGLFLFGSTKYTIIQVVTGLNGIITISGTHNTDPGIQAGKEFFVYNNTGLGNATVKYTVQSVAPNVGNTNIVITGTIPGAATNNGTLYSNNDWHNVVIAGYPTQDFIDMNGNKIINVGLPSVPGDAVNKEYVDALANGIVWIQPVLDPNLFNDSLSSPPVVDSTVPYHKTYIVKSPGSGAWAGLDNHAMIYDPNADIISDPNADGWVDILGRAVQPGDRFGVFAEPNPEDPLTFKAAGGLLGNDGRIATVATVSPLTWSFYNPVEPDAFTVVGISPLPPAPNTLDRSPHYGHSYTFRGTAPTLGTNTGFGTTYDWIEFSGPASIVAGTGIIYSGNVLNVGAGTGIAVNANDVALSVSNVLSLYNLSTNGMVARTASNTVAARTITGTASNISVTNGDGVSSNPTIDLVNAGTPVTTSFVKITTDTKGRVAATTAVLSADITAALGYTPVNKAGDSMISTANLTFVGGGEVLGLPAVPSGAGAAASKAYVDASAGGTVTSIGLTSTDITVGGTSPITTSGTFTLTLPTVNANVGTFNNVTVTGKGLVTAASNVAYIPYTVGTTKGDLITFSAAATPVVLPAGTNGYAIIADSTSPSGIRYEQISNMSAGNGVVFFPEDTILLGTSTQNAYEVNTLLKGTPGVGAETVDAIGCTTDTVLSEVYLYDTPLGGTQIDAGVWDFDTYCSVSSTTAGRVSTITRNMFLVEVGTGTLTITGSGTTRTATASSGTPFVAGDASAFTANGSYLPLCGYVKTPNGIFPINTFTSGTVVDIRTLSTYTNESTVTYTVYKRLFGVTTPAITTLTTNYQLVSVQSVQPAFPVTATSKLAHMTFGTSNNTTTVNFVHGGTTNFSHVHSPLSTRHNDLSGLNSGNYQHLTPSELSNVHIYDISGGTAGVPTASAKILTFVAVRTFTLPASLTGSMGVAGMASSALTTFDIKKNGFNFGTMQFAISATTATFTAASLTTFTAGDILTVVAPVSPDATLADIGFTLVGAI